MRETVFISQDDCYLFGTGTHYDIYKKLGAHPSCEYGVDGMYFAVWAPNAAAVHVIGTFNDWDEGRNQLERIGDVGIYAGFIPGVGTGELYKYLITARDGRKLYKADPYANQAELRPPMNTLSEKASQRLSSKVTPVSATACRSASQSTHS